MYRVHVYCIQGYTGKMYLDQGWLTQQTSDSVFWRLTATFQNEVKEFKGSILVGVHRLIQFAKSWFKATYENEIKGLII